LIPVTDNVADLKNELLILKDSIRSIMRMIIKMTETNELGQFLIRDEMLENFFNDYFFIKKDGLIPGYIEEIEKMLRKIVKTDAYENMIKEYQSFYNTDAISAREVVDGQLAEVRSFISYEYVKEMLCLNLYLARWIRKCREIVVNLHLKLSVCTLLIIKLRNILKPTGSSGRLLL